MTSHDWCYYADIVTPGACGLTHHRPSVADKVIYYQLSMGQNMEHAQYSQARAKAPRLALNEDSAAAGLCNCKDRNLETA